MIETSIISQMKKVHLDILNLAGELKVLDDTLEMEYVHNLLIPTLSHLNAITEFLSYYTLNDNPSAQMEKARFQPFKYD